MAILRFLALTLRSGFIIWMLTILSISNWTHLGVSIVMGVPNSWIVCNEKSYKMDALGVHTLFQVPPKDTRRGHFVIIFDGGYPKPMVLNARMCFVQLWQYLGKWLQYRKLKGSSIFQIVEFWQFRFWWVAEAAGAEVLKRCCRATRRSSKVHPAPFDFGDPTNGWVLLPSGHWT